MLGPARPRAHRARAGGEPALSDAPVDRRNGFGIAIDLHDGVVLDALATGHGAGRRPPTVVRVAPPGGLDGWPAASAHETRRLEAGGRLVFSVEHAPGYGLLLTMRTAGRFLLDEGGMEIACAPSDGVADWPAGLTIHALPLACTLRGLEPFHASAVAFDDKALMLAGAVTAGKSTLAAMLVERGASLLSDDVVAVDLEDGVPRAHPGGRFLHLRGPVAEQVGERLQPAGARGGRPRFAAPLADGPRTLAAICLLEPGTAGEPAIEPMPASGTALVAATYNLSVRDPRRLERQLALVHDLALRVPVYRVRVVRGADPGRLADSIAEHAA